MGDPRDAYVVKYGLVGHDQYINPRNQQTQQQANLQYDPQIADLKSQAQAALGKLDQQLSLLPQKYDPLRQNERTNEYQRGNRVEELLAKSGMMNSGAHVGNEQLIQRDLASNLGKIDLAQTNETNGLNQQKTDTNNNMIAGINKINGLKNAYIAAAMAQAESDYNNYLNDSIWKGQQMDMQKQQLALQRQRQGGSGNANVDWNAISGALNRRDYFKSNRDFVNQLQREGVAGKLGGAGWNALLDQLDRQWGNLSGQGGPNQDVAGRYFHAAQRNAAPAGQVGRRASGSSYDGLGGFYPNAMQTGIWGLF